MKDKDKDKPEPQRSRRILKGVTHDERGNATMEWTEIPAGHAQFFERVPLSIEGAAAPPEPKRARTDLRKLDEFIRAKRLAAMSKDNDDK